MLKILHLIFGTKKVSIIEQKFDQSFTTTARILKFETMNEEKCEKWRVFHWIEIKINKNIDHTIEIIEIPMLVKRKIFVQFARELPGIDKVK